MSDEKKGSESEKECPEASPPDGVNETPPTKLDSTPESPALEKPVRTPAPDPVKAKREAAQKVAKKAEEEFSSKALSENKKAVEKESSAEAMLERVLKAIESRPQKVEIHKGDRYEIRGDAHNVGGEHTSYSANGGGVAEKPVKTDLPSFLRLSTPRELSALIALASLESVPAEAFFSVLDALCERMPKERIKGDERPASPYLETVENLLAPFPIVQTGDGAEDALQNIRMISFKNEDFAAYVRARVWKDYFKYRNDIIVWLCDLRQNTDGVANRLVARLAMRTLAGYAALDMGYARREIIPYLERNFQKQRDVKYLEDFFRNLLRTPDCRESADTLLCRWCRRVPGIFWQVPYRLYAQGEGLEFQSAAANALEEALWNDLTARPTLDSVESLEKAIAWLSEDRAYFLYPAHEDVVTAELLSEKIAALFLAQTKQATRYQTAEFFLMLLRWDYLTDCADSPELLFLRGLRKKAVREKILPLFRFIWRYAELRRMMERVLTAHLAEIAENHASYEYLERPLRYLAFTGDRNDYYNAIYFLRECAKDPDAKPAAEDLERCLSDYLQSRKHT